MAKLKEKKKKETIKKKGRENYRINIWQRCYTDGTTRDSTKNIGDNWEEIGENRREKEKEEEEEEIEEERIEE